jgi:PAS domain S-box-containing protein
LDDAIFQVNNDFKIEKINYAGLKLLDKNAEDVIGRNCYEVIHNTDEPVENCPHMRSQKSGQTETLTSYSEPLGKWLDVKDCPVILEGDEVDFHLHLIRDVTDLKLAEKKLRESEEKFKVLSENVSDGIIMVEKVTITYVSSGYQKLIGLSDVDLKNLDRKKLLDRIHPEDRFIIETIIKDSQKALFSEYKYKYRIQHGNGNYIWVEDKINSNYNNQGNCILSIIHSRDINDSMEYELRLTSEKKELEKLNVAKNKLLSIIAHDLRNPFSAILGASDILFNNIKEGNLSELEFLAETINNSAENAYFLLENLLAWSRSQRGLINLELKLIKLKDLIDRVISNTSKLAENKR